MAYSKHWPQSSSLKKSIARRMERRQKEAYKKACVVPEQVYPMGMYLVEQIDLSEDVYDVWKGYDR